MIVIALLLSACGQDPVSALGGTCAIEDNVLLEVATLYPPPDGGLNGLSISEGCAVALIESVGGDPAALLLDVEGAADWGTQIEEVRLQTRPLEGVTAMVWGLFWLLGADYGEVGELEAGPYVAESWVSYLGALAEELGLGATAPLGRVLLADVTERLGGVGLLPEGTAGNITMTMDRWPSNVHKVPRSYDMSEWTSLALPWQPNVSAAFLFHNAHHAMLDAVEHVDCEGLDGEFGCDPGLDGTFGAEFAARWVEVQVELDGADCVPDDDPAVKNFVFDTEDYIRENWELMILEGVPEIEVVGFCS